MAFALCAVCVTAAFLEHANQLARTPEHVGRARLTMGFTEGRRPDRVGQVVRSELATVLHSGAVHGNKKISGRLLSMISIVDIDMSPDLRNARVKVSIIGDRKDKISAVRWLQGSAKPIRHVLAQRLKGMKRIPQLSFQHVDVGAAVDMMVKIQELSEERQRAEAARGEGGDAGALEFDGDDDDAFAFDDNGDDELDFTFEADEEEEDLAAKAAKAEEEEEEKFVFQPDED